MICNSLIKLNQKVKLNKKYALVKISSILFFSLGLLCQTYSQTLIPLRKDFQWGYADSTKQIVIPIQFEEALLFEHGLAHVRKNGKWGIINTKGKWVISPKFNHLYRTKNGLISATEVDGKTIFNKEGKLIFPKGRWHLSDVGNIGSFGKDGMSDPTTISGRKGIINSNGTVLIPANRYWKFTLNRNKDYIESQIDTVINNEWVAKKGLFDLDGNLILPPQYATIKNLSLDRWLVGSELNKRSPGSSLKCEIVDSKNQPLTNKKFNRGYFLSNLNLVVLKSNKQSGIFDLNGKNIFGKMFDYLEILNDEVFIAGNNNKCSLYKFDGGKINSLQFDQPEGMKQYRFYKNLMLFSVNDKFGIMNFGGKVIVQPSFDFIYFLDYFDRNGFFVFIKNKLQGIADKNGNIVVDPKYTSIRLGPQQTAIIQSNKQHSLIDFSGNTIIPFGKHLFSFIPSDHKTKDFNLLTYQLITNDRSDRPYGIMNTKGKILIPPKFYKVNKFYNNHLTVSDIDPTNKRMYLGVVDKYGKELIAPSEFKYLRIFILPKGKFELWERDSNPRIRHYRIGQMNHNGMLDLPYNFKIKEEFDNGNFIGFNNEAKHGLLDSNFQILIPFDFQSLYLAGSNRFYGYKPENRRLHIFDSNYEYQFPPIYDRVDIKTEHDSIFEAVLNKVVVGYFDKNKNPYFSDSGLENYTNHFVEKKKEYEKITKIETDKYLKRIKGHPARFKNNTCEKIKGLSEKHKCSEKALEEFLVQQIKDSKTSLTGNVKVSFNITKKGSIEKIKILKSDNKDLNDIAISIIQSLPPFIPTKSFEENISTRKILTLDF